MQMNHNLFKALKLERRVMFIILTLIVLVAAFNIASSLIMLVMGKTKDIAILKAMGAADRSIRKIFVFNGMVIGIVGTSWVSFSGHPVQPVETVQHPRAHRRHLLFHHQAAGKAGSAGCGLHCGGDLGHMLPGHSVPGAPGRSVESGRGDSIWLMGDRVWQKTIRFRRNPPLIAARRLCKRFRNGGRW
jgi:hypothetical protein